MDFATTSTVAELRTAGLLTESYDAVLTPKGREWLRALEDFQNEEIATYAAGAADLIMATSGLLR